MYVIFPADEVVYLSYGRLMYLPSSPTPDNRLNTPIRTSEESEVNNIPVTPPPGSNPSSRKPSTESTFTPTDKPTTSGYNNFERRKSSLNGKSVKIKPTSSSVVNTEPLYSGSLDRQKTLRGKTPERAYTSNSNKSSKSSKHSSSSSKSRSQAGTSREKFIDDITETSVRNRTISESAKLPTPTPVKKLSSNSFKDFLKPKTKEKSQETAQVRPERRKDKKPLRIPERQYSYSDYLTVNRERTEIPRSELINTRIDQCEHTASAKPSVKREKSPVIRFFRAQSSSPRNLPGDKSVFDFDVLFDRDPSPGKLSVGSSHQLRSRENFDACLPLNRVATSPEKTPTKKRGFFSSLRVKKTPNKAADMATSESPLKDLIHPAYNEPLKSHNAVTFKLVRTGHVARKSEALQNGINDR